MQPNSREARARRLANHKSVRFNLCLAVLVVTGIANRFFRARLLCGTGAIVAACLLAVLTLAPGPCAFGQTQPPPYEVTVHNNFGPREFYNATPKSSQIWLYTNFQCDIWTANGWQSWNPTPGTYSTAIQLSTISQGKIRIYREKGGTRLYAILSATAPAPSSLPPDQTSATPYTYFEWSFGSTSTDPAYPYDPGTLDLSWIDRWDFLSRLVVSNLPSSPSTMVYGSKKRQSTAAVGGAMAGYASQSIYAWLGTFSQPLSFPGATNAIGWVTGNSTLTTGASQIGSLTRALDQVSATAETSPAWTTDTPTATGQNWTTAGFRVGTPEAMGNPAGGATCAQNGWAAYVNFTKDPQTNQYTMTLSGFTLYTIPPLAPSAQKVWSAHDDAADAVYTLTQDEGLLDCIWISSFNNIPGTPPLWITNINSSTAGNAANIMYAIYNAIASGVIYKDVFVTNTQLPPWPGYEPRIEGINTYDFEILTAGAPVAGGLAGYLKGQDMIDLLNNQAEANLLVNPYFLVLLGTQEVTPAYLYPSQDVWASNGVVGPPPVLGLQNGPLNGSTVFGDNATFNWYLGGGLNHDITGALMLLLLN